MEKSIVIVMDEERFEEQSKEIYELRKTSIHTYEGDMIAKLNEQQKEIEHLKSSKQKITECWINALIANIELMDKHQPDWRMFAGKEIKELQLLLKQKYGSLLP